MSVEESANLLAKWCLSVGLFSFGHDSIGSVLAMLANHWSSISEVHVSVTKSASVDNLHSLYIFLSPLYPRVFPLLQGTCKMTRGGHSLLQISAEVDTRFISY